ncbi:MAG: ABC transporter permease [Sutterella sp.]
MTDSAVLCRRPSAAAAVKLVALKEFRDCLRSRWLLFGSSLFAILSVAVFFGTAAIGGTLQYQPLSSVMNSLLSLTVFLLPLLALLLCYDAFVGEAESGTLLLMLTYPLSRLQWLAGKAIGQGGAILLVLAAGFAVLPLIQAFLPVPYGMAELLGAMAVLIATGWLLGLVFMLVAYWVSLTVRHKAQALALLLVVWFTAVLLYDLALLVISVAGADTLGRSALTALMLANPASVFRLINQAYLGILSFDVPSAWLLGGLLVLWSAVLFVICAALLRSRRL